MGRSPEGVAIGVSGEAQGQFGQPGGHESFKRSTQRGGCAGPPGTTQHSCPAVQHSESQHVSAPQLEDVHGGVPQVPLSQKGKFPEHSRPHPPQFLTSLLVFAHCDPQQVKPAVEQSVGQPAAPALPALAPPPPFPLPPLLLPPVLAPPLELPAAPPLELPAALVPPVSPAEPSDESSPLESPSQAPTRNPAPTNSTPSDPTLARMTAIVLLSERVTARALRPTAGACGAAARRWTVRTGEDVAARTALRGSAAELVGVADLTVTQAAAAGSTHATASGCPGSGTSDTSDPTHSGDTAAHATGTGGRASNSASACPTASTRSASSRSTAPGSTVVVAARPTAAASGSTVSIAARPTGARSTAAASGAARAASARWVAATAGGVTRRPRRGPAGPAPAAAGCSAATSLR